MIIFGIFLIIVGVIVALIGGFGIKAKLSDSESITINGWFVVNHFILGIVLFGLGIYVCAVPHAYYIIWVSIIAFIALILIWVKEYLEDDQAKRRIITKIDKASIIYQDQIKLDYETAILWLKNAESFENGYLYDKAIPIYDALKDIYTAWREKAKICWYFYSTHISISIPPNYKSFRDGQTLVHELSTCIKNYKKFLPISLAAYRGKARIMESIGKQEEADLLRKQVSAIETSDVDLAEYVKIPIIQ